MLLSSTFTSDCKPPIRAFQSPREMIQTPHFIHSLAFSPVEQWVWTQKKQLLRSFYVMWTQQKTSAGGDREQLMLLLFICSKSGKSKLTRKMVILRFEIQNLKEQFTSNSRLHVFPQPCISGLCWHGFPAFSYFVFLDHEVHSSSWSTWKYTWKPLCWSHAPVSHEVHKLCCEQFHVGTIFFLPNYNHPTVCSGKRARTHVGTLIPVTGCKHWPVLLSRAVMLAVCVLLWAGRNNRSHVKLLFPRLVEGFL